MNIFFLALDPKKSARFYYNKHCIKIILEIAQILYCAHWITNDGNDTWLTQHSLEINLPPYKKTHVNHPMSKWTRQSYNNYMYACQLGLELCYEYSRRYGNKIHKTQARLEWLICNAPLNFVPDEIQGFLATRGIPAGCTPIPLTMPTEYHTDDAVQSYRQYYIKAKQSIAQSTEAYEQLVSEWNIK